MNREQVIEFRDKINEQQTEVNRQLQEETGLGHPDFEEHREKFLGICNMALNSIPLKFDPEDETTWPEKHGLKCIIYRISPHILEAAEWRVGKCEHEETGWFVDCRKTKDKLVTHYMPIPEAGESK